MMLGGSRIQRSINKFARKHSTPIAILVKKDIFDKTQKEIIRNNYKLERIKVLKFILDNVSQKTKIFSSTGYISRELDYVIRNKKYR